VRALGFTRNRRLGQRFESARLLSILSCFAGKTYERKEA
jgi:hypothetical protein